MAFFQQQCFLKFASYNARDFKVLSTLQHSMFAKFFLSSQQEFREFFLPLISIDTAKLLFGFFFTFHITENPFLRFTQKRKGVKQGKGVIYNEKYLQVFSQKPFWYKKVFSEKQFSKA